MASNRGIKDAIVEILKENAEVIAWATGGVFARRADQLPQTSPTRRRDKYITVRVTDSYLEETDTQEAAVTLTTDKIRVSVWASSSRDADAGAHAVRHALDNMHGPAADLTIQRIRWLGTTDEEVEDASGAEQLIDECRCEFTVSYDLP